MVSYNEKYSQSWALCIGINNYVNASPLDYAVSDAKEIAKILQTTYKFESEKIITLVDEDATRENIFRNYLDFANKTELDDRIIIFFAGHGYTFQGNRGEIGYLLPHDGRTDDFSSLLRWDDLTRNSEIIKAKHMFFILDACFSGLAITRALPRGSMRFLKDMLKRNSRQVIAAGKANQTVSDSGGPVPEHSIFTGHLINGLNGEASGSDNILTANGLMSYVYGKVSKDYRSQQTPHFGFFEGDGDFIFNLEEETEVDKNEHITEDRLFEVPITNGDEIINTELSFLDRTKEYISDNKYRIKLDDLITSELKLLLSQINNKEFPLEESDISEEKIKQRLWKYDNVTLNIRTLSIAISNWGNESQKALQSKIVSRLSDHLTYNGGVRAWIALRWFPLLLQMYNMGIPYLLNDDYESLYRLFNIEVTPFELNNESKIFIRAYGQAVSEINQINVIKIIKEHERHYVPLNEYLFKTLQPLLEDILFLGKSYENYFDRLEILIGLIHADIYGNSQYGRYWGPLGRYAWKYTSRYGENNPFIKLKTEAFDIKDNWAPIKAGFFNSSFARCEKTINEFEDKLKKLNWF